MKHVYHASPKSGLDSIEPRKSTHGTSWVYGTVDKIMSSVFLGRNLGDFSCGVGRERDGMVFICERYRGALEERYNTPGSIYTLPGETFEQKTTWKEEYVSEGEMIPLGEEKIGNALEYIESLQKEGKLRIYRYPERPSSIPTDDSDLVRKAVGWFRQGHKDVIRQLSERHPHLIERVNELLVTTQ